MGPDFFDFDVETLRRNRGMFLVEGILFLVLGCLAIAMPILFTLAADFLFGILFIVGGIAQLVRVYKTWGISGTWPSLFVSLITLCAGIIMLINPLAGILALTSLLAAYFLCAGIVKCVLSLRLDTAGHKFWVFISGLISLALGVLIISGLPGTAAWVIGLFIGIDMLFLGILLIGLYSSLPSES